RMSFLGISFSSIKDISEFYEHGRLDEILRRVEVVRTWSVWTGGGGMLLCALFSPLISRLAFGDASHVLPVCQLSPVVCFMSVTAGEVAILKAVRRLKRVALVSVLGAAVTLLLTIPFYYFWGMWGVVPALVASTLGVMVAHLSLSLPVFPWRVDLRSRAHFRAGWGLVRLGVPYILAAAMNTFVSMGLGIFLARTGSLSDVGLYNLGYNLVFTYAGIVFTAVDADYFPRLSAVNADVDRMNLTINRQIKVCVLLMSPFLVVFMLAMPLVIRLLYSSDFLPMTGMAVCASLHLFFKSMTLPVAYISLAKGDAVTYLCMEVAYDVCMAVCVVVGFCYWGILGTGIALALAGIFDWVMIVGVYGRLYGYRSDSSARPFALGQLVCVIAALVLGLQSDRGLKVLVGLAVLIVSAGLSIRVLCREMTLFSVLKDRLKGKFPFRRK
ncbi:MAG: oligosaccharide flippase family protein, partial [Paraprevotella sp.]|nr:oligosaccharide flippase family protein [Paraprevotella sp.]